MVGSPRQPRQPATGHRRGHQPQGSGHQPQPLSRAAAAATGRGRSHGPTAMKTGNPQQVGPAEATGHRPQARPPATDAGSGHGRWNPTAKEGDHPPQVARRCSCCGILIDEATGHRLRRSRSHGPQPLSRTTAAATACSRSHGPATPTVQWYATTGSSAGRGYIDFQGLHPLHGGVTACSANLWPGPATPPGRWRSPALRRGPFRRCTRYLPPTYRRIRVTGPLARPCAGDRATARSDLAADPRHRPPERAAARCRAPERAVAHHLTFDAVAGPPRPRVARTAPCAAPRLPRTRAPARLRPPSPRFSAASSF